MVLVAAAPQPVDAVGELAGDLDGGLLVDPLDLARGQVGAGTDVDGEPDVAAAERHDPPEHDSGANLRHPRSTRPTAAPTMWVSVTSTPEPVRSCSTWASTAVASITERA